MSTANVSQLAVDLLIASLSLLHIGTFDSRDLVPVVGAREDGEQGITTPLECALHYNRRWDVNAHNYHFSVYGKEGIDVVVVQQRSPVLKVWALNFFEMTDSYLSLISVSQTRLRRLSPWIHQRFRCIVCSIPIGHGSHQQN